jgi:hypothetical protein
MGIAYKIDPEAGVTYVVYDGIVTGEDFIAHTHRLIADPAWPPGRRLHLTDMTTQSAPHTLSPETIRSAADMWAPHTERIKKLRLAAVANDAFSNAQIFESTMNPHGPTIIVFNTLSTACVWLGIDADRAYEALRNLRQEYRMANAG